MGYLPPLVKGQIESMPSAVVQPRDTQELATLLKIAVQNKISIVPRGSATAGYGGAVPTKGGIVVDVYRMSKILELDVEKQTATVEPGVLWNNLEIALKAKGMALRLYPGSAKSASVGGWIANGGGVGIGSYEYGYLRSNIIEIELVTPTGTLTLKGKDIDLVEAMAGTTGLISRAVVKVRKADEDVPVLAAFPTVESLQAAFAEIGKAELPLWEIGFKDPTHIKLTYEAIKIQAAKYSGDHHKEAHEITLPEGKFIASFVYPKGRESAVQAKLEKIIKANKGDLLSEKIAKFDWVERYYPMRLKAAGPSMIPSEVMVPTNNLPALANEMRGKIKGLAFMGTLVEKGKEVSVLTYMLDDERRRGFTFANAQSFIPIKSALKLGGRPYTVGMLMTDMAALVIGEDRLQKAFAFKKKVDPGAIMNPGKVFPIAMDQDSPIKGLVRMMKLARSASGAAKLADAVIGGKGNHDIGGNTAVAKHPFGQEVQWDAFSCTNCGYCRTECTLFNGVGWESASPRGKYHFLREYLKGNVKMDQRMAELFSVCTTCRRCNQICQVGSSIDEDWGLTMKSAILKDGYHPPTVYQRAAHNVLINHNAAGQPPDKRLSWVTPEMQFTEEGELLYWAGCQASFIYTMRNVPTNGMRILNKGGIVPVYLGLEEWCCGAPMVTAGTIDEIKELVKHNVGEMNRRGVKTLVTSCPGCWVVLAHYYPILAKQIGIKFDIQIRHITEIMAELLEQGKLKPEIPVPLKVTYHDSCHIGRGGGIYEPPRKVINSIPGVEFVEMPRNREESACCGKHILRYPGLTNTIHKARVDEAAATGAEALTIACPTCEANFRIGVPEFAPGKMEVLDVSDLLAVSLGLPVPSVSKIHKLLRKKTLKK
jgi:Fe-S oxidoreductase/FAD/FMN-containing dehydrogenase